MKVKEIIDFKVRDLLGVGVTPRYLILTAWALKALVREVHAELGENAAAALQQAEATITYQNLEVVVAELSRLEPVTVSGIVREEMDIYSLKVAGMAPQPKQGANS
jgi:hypothetical protein